MDAIGVDDLHICAIKSAYLIRENASIDIDIDTVSKIRKYLVLYDKVTDIIDDKT